MQRLTSIPSQFALSAYIAFFVIALSDMCVVADEPEKRIPTKAEAHEFASKMEKAVAEKDRDILDSLVDWDEIIRRSMENLNIRPEMLREAQRETKNSLYTRAGMASQLFSFGQEGTKYTFLRVREMDGQKTAVFRALMGNGGTNYHEWILIANDGGKIRAVDAHVFAAGEKISQILRRAFLPIIAQKEKSLLEKLSRKNKDFIGHFDDLLAMGRAAALADDPNRALEIYRRLPKSVSEQKYVMLIRIRAAQRVSEDDYKEATDEYKRLFPNDPGLDLICLDELILNKKFDLAYAAIDRLEKAVGGDPSLDATRAVVAFDQGDLKKARKFAEKAHQHEDTLLSAYWALASISLQEKDFKQVLDLLLEIEKKFELEFGDLAEIPEYAEFIKSPEYEKWLQR